MMNYRIEIGIQAQADITDIMRYIGGPFGTSNCWEAIPPLERKNSQLEADAGSLSV